MIRINLLPKELQRVKPTPWPKLLGLFLAMALILAVALIYVYYHFNLLPRVVDRERQLAEQSQGLMERAEEADRLRAEISDFELREKTIKEIRSTRYMWSKKFDQLLDIIPADMWLTALAVTEPRQRTGTTATGPTMQMDCMLLGTEKDKIADFRRGVINHPIYKDVAEFPEFAWSVVLSGNPADPAEQAMKFKADLILKSKMPETTKTSSKRKKRSRG